MPLSEEEQRILQEMEQKLYEHDRDFANRVSHGSNRLRAPRGARWSIVVFVAGFAVLLSTFRFSVALGAFGFFLMLGAALALSQTIREGASGRSSAKAPRSQNLAHDWSEVRRRIRSRFGHRP